MNLKANQRLGSLRTWVPSPCRVATGTPRWLRSYGRFVGQWTAWPRFAQLWFGLLNILWMGRNACYSSKWQIWQGKFWAVCKHGLCGCLGWVTNKFLNVAVNLKTYGVMFQKKLWTILCDPWLQLHVDCWTLFLEFVQVWRSIGPCHVRFRLHRSPKMLQRRAMSFCCVKHAKGCDKILASHVITWLTHMLKNGKTLERGGQNFLTLSYDVCGPAALLKLQKLVLSLTRDEWLRAWHLCCSWWHPAPRLCPWPFSPMTDRWNTSCFFEMWKHTAEVVVSGLAPISWLHRLEALIRRLP